MKYAMKASHSWRESHPHTSDSVLAAARGVRPLAVLLRHALRSFRSDGAKPQKQLQSQATQETGHSPEPTGQARARDSSVLLLARAVD